MTSGAQKTGRPRDAHEGVALTGAAREAFVEKMFDDIAAPYDDLNRVLSLGRDLSWRRAALHLAGLRPGAEVVDLGCGTGDFSLAAAERVGDSGAVVGVDLSEGMLARAREKIGASGRRNVKVVRGNAQETGLPAARADAVLMGWSLRNVGDRKATYREVARLLKPEGRLVVLDCSKPTNPFVRFGFAAHVRCVLPILARFKGGDPEAYRYLAASTEAFLTADELAAELTAAGFRDVAYRGFMCGTIAAHVGVR
jgi:demethylmenaquinone methyltransferase / 2-methoxy-6-polyprenyl-1,4-benzoquinol methylase